MGLRVAYRWEAVTQLGPIDRRVRKPVANSRSRYATAFLAIVYLYSASVLVAEPYYNWRFARQNGFAAWLIWGETQPTLQALIWPYFAFHNTQQKSEAALQPLSQKQINEASIESAWRAVTAAQQATYIIDSRKPNTPLDKDQVAKIIDFSLQSLSSANAADEQTLNNLYPEFGTRLKRDFCESQRLVISGLQNNSKSDLLRSADFDNAWRDWYTTNRKQIEETFNSAIN
jgi:hypothetical protein